MRKLFAIPALCCLLFVTGGYHLYFQLRLAEVKLKMKNELLQAKQDEQTKLSFSDKEMQALEWEETLEFRYRDEMYDVVKIEKQNGQNIIWCISDTKETVLLDQYLNTQRQSSEKNSSTEIVKLLAVPFIPVRESNFVVSFHNRQQKFADYLFHIPSSEHFVQTPPPKAC